MISWTTKCVATIMVLATGLMFGRQVLLWWAVGSPTAVAFMLPTVVTGTDNAVRLQFGDQSWSIGRRCVIGTRESAAGELRAECRRLVRQNTLPEDTPGKAERRFLDFIAARKPVEQQPGSWQLYELEGTTPMAAGVRYCGEPGAVVWDNVAAPGRRVTTWGFAVPATEDRWTLYTFHAAGSHDDVLLPPGSRRTLSIETADGSRIIAFTSDGKLKIAACGFAVSPQIESKQP
jgi:hypothetical protein